MFKIPSFSTLVESKIAEQNASVAYYTFNPSCPNIRVYNVIKKHHD